MRIGLFSLVAAYALSQFFRAFLAVLAPVLEADLGATKGDLSFASGLWFAGFALFQLPVGAALDRFGPRRTVALIFGIGGAGGAALFALAQSPGQIAVAMALIGAGCAPVLMGLYYIFARTLPAAAFATLAGAAVGAGSLGNVAGAAPLAWAVETFGWRETLGTVAGLSALVAVALWLLVRDPAPAVSEHRGSILDLFRIRALWPILAMMAVNYAPAAGIRGLWAGPYAADVFGADAGTIGQVTLVMGLAMICGNFAYGPMDRLTGSRKWVVFGGNVLCVAALSALAFRPDGGLLQATALLAAVGFFGSSYAMLMAHGRSLFPDHLTGRGVSLLNFFSMSGVGVVQFTTGPIHAAVGGDTSRAYGVLFALFAGFLAIGLVPYLFSADRAD